MSALPYAHPRRTTLRPNEARPGDRVRTYHRGRPTYATVLRTEPNRSAFLVCPDNDTPHPFLTLNVQFFARPAAPFNRYL